MKRGFTLVECMLASSIFCLIALALFEAVIVTTRIVHENSDLLVAEAVAWDAVWKRFNESVDDLSKDVSVNRGWETLPRAAAPLLHRYDTVPKIRITVQAGDQPAPWTESGMRKISADVEWGRNGRRHRLSDYRQVPVVYRGELGRVL